MPAFSNCVRVFTALAAFALALGTVFTSTVAIAQEFPSKPIRMIIPQSPGTLGDLVGRLMSQEMAKPLGQPIVVENRPGASMIIGFEFVAKNAPADGYTIICVSLGDLAILPVTSKDLRFDPLKDLPAFVGVGEARFAFGSSALVPWKTFNEMVAFAKANPGKLNYGASSPSVRLPMETLTQDLGLNVVHVPYATGGTYLNALLAGEVQMGILNLASAISYGEKFRILAVTGEQRTPALRDTPTFVELGHPKLLGLIYTLHARAGTPAPITSRLYTAAQQALQRPDAKPQFAKIQVEAAPVAGEIINQRLEVIARTYADIARKIGVQPQ